ncbi:hypothetical protein M413DRAFT_23565 [Hebeloma cylindrosporum]|uniref:Nephrocystin 3-like N-terminal domain-containing protein n=1 Tax=Hebeloma cylindrosporum TaxID=76867 RepID=A0A0C3CF04_HEBCY|nr:hypothetical protein M413DRAFT_23565 [Hebeloma cylindrosporum h7]
MTENAVSVILFNPAPGAGITPGALEPFLSSGDELAGKKAVFSCTFAYLLALHVPGLREDVNRAMWIDPTLPNKDLDTQFQTLIIKAFQRLSSPPTEVPFVIIDGLDECQGLDTQKRIIKVLGDALQEYNMPPRFLIASRPDPHLREMLDFPSLNQKTRGLFSMDHCTINFQLLPE